MEICFENKTEAGYRECCRLIRRSQETMESVVPDTREDIGRIASVRTELYLKSKELTGRGLRVTGELEAVLLTITEGEQALSFLRIERPFSLDYELEGLEDESLAQVRLWVSSTEARLLNPRKVSVTAEICGELTAYCHEEMPVETLVPEAARGFLQLKRGETEAVLLNAVCEKSFVLNEQFVLPQGQTPDTLVSREVNFRVEDVQQVGTRLIVKGQAEIALCCLSGEQAAPLCLSFRSPFSQIVDTGADSCDSCSAIIHLSSAYWELTDAISGEKALDVELHAVLQLVSRSRINFDYVADAYCNRMNAMCCVQNRCLILSAQRQSRTLRTETHLNIGEDCRELLCVFSTVTNCSLTAEEIHAGVQLEILYRSVDGRLSCARRSLSLEGEGPGASARLLDLRVSETQIQGSGENLDCRVSLELSFECCREGEILSVESVRLDEESALDLASLPTLHLVRAGDEELWELAKRYHSSVEAIRASNAQGSESGRGLLLIPREC